MSIGEYVGGGIMALIWIVASILALIIHVWTIVISFLLSGLFAAILTLVFPVLSEIYWFFKIGSNMGYGTTYCVSMIVFICLIGLLLVGGMIASSRS